MSEFENYEAIEMTAEEMLLNTDGSLQTGSPAIDAGSNLLVRAELAGFSAGSPASGIGNQIPVHFPGLIRRHGGIKPRPVAPGGFGGQSELGYQKHPPADIADAEVHFVILVAEYPVSQYAIKHFMRHFPGIALLVADKGQNPLVNAGDGVSGDRNSGMINPLQ